MLDILITSVWKKLILKTKVSRLHNAWKAFNYLKGLNDQAVADPEEFQGFAQTLSPPPPPPFLNVLWKWNNWVSVRPNYFFFIGYLGKMRENQQSEPPQLYILWTPFVWCTLYIYIYLVMFYVYSYCLSKLTPDIIEFSLSFHPIFGNHRKKWALDCGTITCLNERILQFLNSFMGTFNRMCLAFKRSGFKSGSISFIFLFFLVFFSLFCSLKVHSLLLWSFNFRNNVSIFQEHSKKTKNSDIHLTNFVNLNKLSVSIKTTAFMLKINCL